MSVLGNYVVIPLLLLGVLIFIHELGHFLVAKRSGVKVECFSLGFGRAILKRTVGETEYRIAWIPLGGYVKMLGELPGEELPEAEKQRAFGAQPAWQRIAIALAGPAMNLVLPVVVIAGIAMTGMPTPTSLIGGVRPDSPAARAGLAGGDRLVAIDDEEIWRWQDVVQAVSGNDGEALALEVERGGERRSIQVVPESAPEGRRVLGIEHWKITSVLGLPDADGLAVGAGLRTGDRVIGVNGRRVNDNYGLTSALASASGVLELEVARVVDSQEQRIRVRLDEGPGAWSLERLGAVPVDFGIGRVTPGSPAKNAGLEVGDLLLRIDGDPVISFSAAAEKIRGSEGAPLELSVLRGGQELQIEVVARRQPIQGPDGIETGFAIGIEAAPPHVPGEVKDEVVRNPLRAIGIGVERTTDIFTMTVGGIWQLLTGKVGVENLVGPIGIGKFAGDFFQEKGWHPILNLLCVISVNLAILNLLPIPVLDGGQIALILAELVRGGPISVRTREVAQTLGLSMILVLMGFAFWNDIARHWSDFLGFFKALV